MVSVLASSAVDRRFDPRSRQTKNYRIGMCCFSAKYVALRRKGKNWLARNQNNASEWVTCLSADCCFSELRLYNPTKHVGLGESGRYHHHLIEN